MKAVQVSSLWAENNEQFYDDDFSDQNSYSGDFDDDEEEEDEKDEVRKVSTYGNIISNFCRLFTRAAKLKLSHVVITH